MNREEAAKILHEIEDRWLEPKTYLHERENKALDIAIDALRSPWVKTSDRLPTEADAGVDEEIVTIYDDGETRVMGTDYWAYVAKVPERFPYWLPVPKLPEVEE